jgi:GT2 family glycosyltransferase
MEWTDHAVGDRELYRADESPVSLIVVNFGNQYLARNLLSSLADHPDRKLIREAIIVDNGYPAMGDSRAVLASCTVPFPTRFVQYHGHSYSGSINAGAEGCNAPVLLLCNNDLEWLPGHSIGPVVEQLLTRPDVGVAGPQLVFPDGRWQRSAAAFPSITEGLKALCFLGVLHNRLAGARFRQGVIEPPEEVDYIDGACVAVSRECFTALNGWDPTFEFYACDTDFSWRAKQNGWRRVLVPAARVMHVRGASSSGALKRVYARQLYAAKRRLVERMRGKLAAACYDVLQRVVAIEYALVYGALDALWRTPASSRRATAARESGIAAIENR